jgi:hypothetical protein
LIKVRFIYEIIYLEWLPNVVMVTKTSRKWQICVEFTNLNKTCPKNSFPLPKIGQLVDFIALSFEYLSFLNANSKYYQILIYLDDEEKIIFITN